jgi:butyrate kinase
LQFIVYHIGGGTSIAAHRKGRMIDGNDIVGGEGPMAPTRCGALPAIELIRHCYSGKTEKEVKALCTRSGGFVSLLGTSDALDVAIRAQKGEKVASLAWYTMIYQIKKEIGAMAVALQGKIDGVFWAAVWFAQKSLWRK